ncbi:MAG TPA: plastocyanin/azurin family copper-binding protein [Gemmatimonadaceae bacterium]|nr:plastocyanin/azurin family copper-binding protein [Gemmatimonadaceae bacterium]
MRRVALIICLIALPGLAACGGSSTAPGGNNNGGQTGTSGNSTSNAISVGNDFYSPSSTTVAVGTTVTWTWNSSGEDHSVTFDDGADSGIKTSGTYTRTFSTAGTYPYHCLVHGAAMSGTVVVQ